MTGFSSSPRSLRLPAIPTAVGPSFLGVTGLKTRLYPATLLHPARHVGRSLWTNSSTPPVTIVTPSTPPSSLIVPEVAPTHDLPTPPLVARLVKSVTEYLGIEGNSLAAGGLTIGIIGFLAATLRLFGSQLVGLIVRQFTVSAEFDSRDESYLWILNYLADHPVSKRTTRFSVTTSVTTRPGASSASPVDTNTDTTPDGLFLPRIFFLPSPGKHLLTFRRRLLWLSRERSKALPGGSGSDVSSGHERITISALGRSRAVLESLTVEARRRFVDLDRARTVIHSADQYGNWRRTRSRPIRPLGTIVLDEGVKESVMMDVRDFLASERWYAERGIPYRRGYMFYGYPGTGKTSFVTAMAGELKLNIYVVSLANKGLTDETLTELMVDTPTRCILLLEDIDAAFVSRSPLMPPATVTVTPPDPAIPSSVGTAGTTVTNVTFSGLLNAIDGVAAQEGRILIMTTNHLEKLDAALIRPGRVDVRVHFDRATRAQVRQLFEQFYPHDDGEDGEKAKELGELAQRFADGVPDKKCSMAAVQGFLMRYKGDPRKAVEEVGRLVEEVSAA